MTRISEAEKKLIEDSDLFDRDWYLKTYPDVEASGIDALDHFVHFGSLVLRSPCPLFDAKFYARNAGAENDLTFHPLLHYLRVGWRQRCNPHPLFDVKWYLEKNEDLLVADVEPLRHFLYTGAFEGREPHRAFPTHQVLERCPQLVKASRNPLDYYLSKEWKVDPCPEATLWFSLQYTSGSSAASSSHQVPCQISPRIPHEKIRFEAPVSTDIRAIAIYLPQYHAIRENDDWWGKGFTEWTNVRRAQPQYEGHYQPHVPHSDIGYYDLNDASLLEKQAAMARAAGIEGFCFYYYWFNGRRLLNMPTDRLLASGKPDFPFCFCWANENWTRTWDGGDKEILMGQEHSDESDERFILDLLPAFRDPRYIRVDGKPLLVVYRPGLLPDPAATALHWRETCRREGIGEIFLARMQMFDWELEGRDTGYDTVIQFPPVSRRFSPSIKTSIQIHDPKSFDGEIYDYRLAAESYSLENIGKNLWPGVSPSWDNTARRVERGHSWMHTSPENYHRWLSTVADRARQTLPPQQRFVFINAWNEWAEGCHLEPDERYGYAWLNATRLAVSNTKPPATPQPRRRILVVGHDAAQNGAQIVLLTMLREWRAIGSWDFQLVLLRDGVLRRDFEAICETLVITDYNNEILRKLAVEKFCRNAPNVILGNTVVIGPFLPTLKHLGATIISYVHELQQSIERWAPGHIMQATVEHSDHFIAVSEPVAQNLTVNHGVPRSQISCLNPYIKTSHMVMQEQLNALRSELSLQPEEKVVFGCGTMDWRKGPDLFAQTAIEVLQKVPEARFFWIGGDTGEEASLRAHRLATDSRIQFLGERNNPRDYLALGHAFFLSSREDPFPLVALEAADTGLPVVCFADAGGMPEFVSDTCGFIIPFEDTQAAAKSIIQLLTDELLRENLGQTAKTSVRTKHDSAKGAAAVLSVLNGLCETTNQKNSPDTSSQPCAAARPLVSVIVPNYNHAKFLSERLESIASQSYHDIEIILLDDFSTDESLEILRAFAAREPRARLVLNSENSGSTFKQWRKGLSLAKGRYVWIAESDDSSHPELLATLVARLDANINATIAACCPRMTDIAGKDLGIPRDWFADIGGNRWESDFSSSGKSLIDEVLSQKNAILNASGVLFRRSRETELLVDDSMQLCGDWLFWIRLLAYGDFEYTAHPLNYWRLASSNARTKPPGEVEWDEGCRVLREIARMLGPDGPGEDRLIEQFRKRCDGWKAKHENESEPAKAATQVPGIFLQRDG
jgi:glycosyltransferase involved in cell wall biosynthesis